MEEKKIVVYVLHGFWENEFTNGCAVVDVSIDLEAVMEIHCIVRRERIWRAESMKRVRLDFRIREKNY